MSEAQLLAYVRATATLLLLPLDDASLEAVALHLGRTATLAQLLDGIELAPDDEPAELYRPAPFPAEDAA